MELAVFGLLALFFLASPLVLLVLHLVARDRIRKLEVSLEGLGEGYLEKLDELEARLRFLENEADLDAPRAAPPAAPETAPAQTGASPVSAAAISMPPVATSASPEATSVLPADALASTATPSISPAAEVPATGMAEVPPTGLSDRREGGRKPAAKKPGRSGAEWEEVIGGSLLNKVGVVVLIVGVALLLGYSMTHLGPAGRVALGLAVSGAMLAAGATFEGRERYRVFARGLIGGGWAGLYFTTFAMHGLDAARIIDSPVVGTALLLAVAVGMILHSIVYRSETVTGLAYFVAFGTLAITPASRFALFASVPVVLSLLYLGQRFRWRHAVVAGVVFTYGAYLMRAVSPQAGAADDWVFGQSLLFFYWIMFELFDLLSLRRRGVGGIDETLFPLNAAGFLLASTLGWAAARPESLWMLFVFGAAGYLLSALVRARLQAPSPDEDATGVGSLLRGGGYEASSLLAASLMVLGIFRGLDGWQQTVALLLEAQLIIMAGLTLRLPFLRHLGSAVLVAPVVGVVVEELPSAGTIRFAGRDWAAGTPTALLTAATLYANRALLRGSRGVRVGGLELVYNWAATFLFAAVLAVELPELWLGPAWLVLALVLLAASHRRAAAELFVQGCVTLFFAWCVTMLLNVPSGELVWGWPARWATALPMVAILYGLANRGRVRGLGTDIGAGDSPDPMAGDEPVAQGRPPRPLDVLADSLDRISSLTTATAATILTSWFLLFEVSGSWLTVAWGIQGVTLLATGFALQARGARLGGLLLLGICVAKVFAYDLSELEMVYQILAFMILGTLLIATSFAYSRYREQLRRLL